MREGLYAHLLGDGWQTLSLPVRRLHAVGSARGVFDVERGVGALARVLSSLMALPGAGRGVAATLEVSEDGGVQTWRRSFGGQALVSVQRAAGALLAERLGPVECRLAIAAEDGALVFRSCGARVVIGALAVPLPRPLSPIIAARAAQDGDGVAVAVEIGLPLAGRLLRYAGRVVPR